MQLPSWSLVIVRKGLDPITVHLLSVDGFLVRIQHQSHLTTEVEIILKMKPAGSGDSSPLLDFGQNGYS